MKRFLLDTNMLVGFIRGADWAKRVYDEYDLGNPDNLTFISVVSRGEILALADKFKWGVQKRSTLEKALLNFTSVALNEQIILSYAALSAWTDGKHPISKPDFPSVPSPSRTMGQNDMWIAATCITSKATLITADKDFEHLNEKLLERILVSPR
jgi:predicted nucleic acid-binding protein